MISMIGLTSSLHERKKKTQGQVAESQSQSTVRNCQKGRGVLDDVDELKRVQFKIGRSLHSIGRKGN